MPYERALPHVDPEAPQSPPRRAALRLMSAPATVALEGTLPFRLIVWRLAPILMRLTGGRFARLFPMPTGVIDTRDARNGNRHRRCVLYFHDRERITVIPTKGGLPSDPFGIRTPWRTRMCSSNRSHSGPSQSRTRWNWGAFGQSPIASSPHA
jgi:hypothetical protein